MKNGIINLFTVAVSSIAMLLIATSPARAADKYSSGDKTWDTGTANWGTVSSGPYNTATWDNAAPDSAFFEGTAGTVTLGEAITAANMTFSTDGYTIDPNGNELTIGSDGKIIANGAGVNVELGDMSGGSIYFEGSGRGTVGAVNAKTYWDGNTWTLTGRAHGYTHAIRSGVLIINPGGTISIRNRNLDLQTGAALHYNNPAAVADRFHENNAYWRWILNTGSFLDNSSGAAITTSTYNPSQWWKGDWTFLGSQGSSSDLYLGTGRVGLDHAGGDVTVTIQDPDTTLTVGGVVSDDYAGTSTSKGYGLAKAGPGTLALTGGTTYTGDTVVDAGTLKLTGASNGDTVVNAAGTLSLGDGFTPSDLSDLKNLSIAPGATVVLDFAGTDDVFEIYTNGVPAPRGTWGRLGSGADNETALITGDGLLNVPVPTALEGVRYWDGGDVNITEVGNSASDGGNGTWDSSTANWDQGAGVAHTNWNNAADDLAVFAETPGTVTLAEDITLGAIFVEIVDGYVIESNTLVFATGGAITNSGSLTIKSAITGSPTLVPQDALTLAPTEGTMTIGAVPSGSVRLDGTTTGNTVDSVGYDASKYGPGTWTVLGDLRFRRLTVDEGKLIVEGKCWTTYRDLNINDGGTIVLNGTFDPRDNDPVNFNSGGTMKGTGTFIGPISVPLNVKAGATIAPGYPTGTFTITNASCTVNGTLAIELDASESPAHSTLAVDGTLDISNATLDVNVTSDPGGTMIIATYDTLTGTEFSSVTGWPSESIDYAANGGTAIALIGAPSGTLLLLK